MHTGLYMLRACWATVVEIRIEVKPVFSSWYVVGDGASHATKRAYIIPG